MRARAWRRSRNGFMCRGRREARDHEDIVTEVTTPLGVIAPWRAVPILTDPMLPTSTNISVDVSAKLPTNVDAVAVFLHKQADAKHPEMQRIPAEFRAVVAQLRSAEMFAGKSNELTIQLVEG